ncbi:site-specific integrase [Metabacillus fastidiosus]|uniref:site-specific integrase n=1 Tax=Metabacillus fastidiosus TaxID=1458 RepID=UPI002DB8F9AA|nr:site-specific integrase [Metabacillus fastidiosus]MEC2078728.1 site-specific integrase [Metabacillus fastidiosus]
MNRARLHVNHEQKYKSLLLLMPKYVEDYIDMMEKKQRSPSTLLNYLLDFKDFFEWLIQKSIADVDSIKNIPTDTLASLPLDSVTEYISEDENKSYRQSSIKRKISALKSLFKYLTTEFKGNEPVFYRNVMQSVILEENNPSDKPDSKWRDNRFNSDWVIDFLNYMRTEYEMKLSTRQITYFLRDKERDYAILSLLLTADTRIAELVELRQRDLDLQNDKIIISRQMDFQEDITISHVAKNALLSYMNVRKERYKGTDFQDESFFLTKYQGESTPISIRTIQELVRKYTNAFKDEISKSSRPLPLSHKANLIGDE